MKIHLLFGALIMGLTSHTNAQPTEAIALEKMKPFSQWIGHWKGEGTMQMGPGEPRKSTVDENIAYKLGGAIILIEGTGKSVGSPTGEEHIVHNAMAVLSFDQVSGEYHFNTFLKDGKSALAWFEPGENNTCQWGFDVPNGAIRYSITIHPVAKTWNEVGEFSNDKGLTWVKFFEMNLQKVEN